MYVIGTAGHVDHGKSTLVKALTDIDPDRLPEEKEREMTVDLGFAWMTRWPEHPFPRIILRRRGIVEQWICPTAVRPTFLKPRLPVIC